MKERMRSEDGEDQEQTGPNRNLWNLWRLENGIPKTKRSRMASGCLEKRNHQADQSNHEENGSRTEGEIGKKLPNDSWMTGFSWPNDAYCACSIAVMRR